MVLDKKGINYTNYSSLSLDVSGNNYRPDINKVQNLISIDVEKTFERKF